MLKFGLQWRLAISYAAFTIMKTRKITYRYFKIFVLTFLILLLHEVVAQLPGCWTWTGGKTNLSHPGIFGTKGVPSPSNTPPGLYEAPEWQDHSGNFWLYGGVNPYGFYDALWKYDLMTNQWTWVSGSNLLNQSPKYGVLGVPSITNSPGFRTQSPTWVDNNNHFWLYGGVGSYSLGGGVAHSDLWRFNPQTTEWTWIKGDSGTTNNNGLFGVKGIENVSNHPAYSEENGVTWVDNINGNLWMVDSRGCLWRYRISTNAWTWMKGDSSYLSNPVFGSIGIPSLLNSPGNSYMQYTRWKTANGDFWYLQNGILWRYQLQNNCWTWMWGDTSSIKNPSYGNAHCPDNDSIVQPWSRVESRSCWIDNCDNLWLMGGGVFTSTGFISLNDMIFYSTKKNEWIWAAGDSVQKLNSSYGTLNISNPTNYPGSRSGAMPFKDSRGNLWLYGGISGINLHTFSDLWMFTPDSLCTECYPTSTGLQNILTNSVLVSPNPTKGEISIKNLALGSKINILDILGNNIESRVSYGSEENFVLTEKGVFFLVISSHNIGKTFKVIVTD